MNRVDTVGNYFGKVTTKKKLNKNHITTRGNENFNIERKRDDEKCNSKTTRHSHNS